MGVLARLFPPWPAAARTEAMPGSVIEGPMSTLPPDGVDVPGFTILKRPRVGSCEVELLRSVLGAETAPEEPGIAGVLKVCAIV